VTAHLLAALASAPPGTSSTTTDGGPVGATSAIGASTAAVAAVYGIGTQAWWAGDGLRDFKLRDTGFFGADTYAGGADKLGHTIAAYSGVHAAALFYEALGFGPFVSTWLGAALVTVILDGIELVDSFTRFGFEYGDVIFNALGVGAGVITRLFPAVDETVGLRLGYWPSKDALASPNPAGKILTDYTGMIYYFDIKAKGLLEALGYEPGFEKHLIGGVAFATHGYASLVEQQQRQLLGGHIGLSMAELLRTFADGDKGTEGIARFFDFYGMPFFSLSFMNDLRSGDWFVSFGLGDRTNLGL